MPLRCFATATLGALSLLLGLSFTSTASAFCRTRTCDPTLSNCTMKDGCVADGKPLYWASNCVSFAVHEAGSPLRDISYGAMNDVVSTAFQRWLGADCQGGDTPTLRVWNYGPVECGKATYNRLEPNANVWSFRDEDWPYPQPQQTLALTIITFNTETGEIFDADVEVNSFTLALTTGNDNVEYDLQSIATHEAGHFLGLTHSPVTEATMAPNYARGDTSLRSLAADDIAGICTLFPPSPSEPSEECTPRHGFSTECTAEVEEEGCGCRLARPRNHGALLAVPLVLFGLRRLGRRRTA